MTAATWAKPGDDARDLGSYPCPHCTLPAAVRKSKGTGRGSGKLHLYCKDCGAVLSSGRAVQARLLAGAVFFAKAPPALAPEPAKPTPAPKKPPAKTAERDEWGDLITAPGAEPTKDDRDHGWN